VKECSVLAERFTLLSELGRGGMGVVWKARDEETGQIVALKVMREMYAEDADYVARFERELELAKRIDSVHVVKVLGYGVRQGMPYLALEYVDGPSLHEALTRHGPYNWPEARTLLAQLAQGLADAHAAGVIHRDVKPSNVLLGPDGVAKLTDFGIARGLDTTRMTATSTMIGTPAYLAPEGPKDARSDLYSLGIIGYELLTGAPPFVGQTYQEVLLAHLRDAPDLARLPEETRPVIGWLLTKDPAARPRNAWEVIPVVEGRLLFVSRTFGVSSRPAPVSAGSGTLTPASRPPSAVRAPVPGSSLGQAARQREGPRAHVRNRRRTGPNISDRGSSGAWALASAGTTRGMIEERAWHTATTLRDGRVLFAGGSGSEAALSLAEVFGPVTTTFSRVRPMTSRRSDHAATILADGRVFICGGKHETVLATAEVFDSRTGAFVETGSMTTRREFHTAKLLPGGLVLVTGGSDGERSLASAEVYDPTTGQFHRAGAMSCRRESHTATLLRDGRVLLAGGDSDEDMSDTADIYNLGGGWSHNIGPMVTARASHTATLLPAGTVLLVGGEDVDGKATNSAEFFDPNASTFRPVEAMMRVAREGHTATLTASGLVLVVGGANDTGAVASVEAFDPVRGTFADVGRLTTGRVDHTASLLSDERLLIAGGLDKDGVPLDSIELLTLEYTP
jgi:serine/threonine protein kinase